MFDLMPWKKREMKDLTRFRGELDNLFSRFFDMDFPMSREFFKEGEWFPRVDIKEGKKDVSVAAEIPGCDAKDIELSLDGRILTIKGEKKQESEQKEENIHRVERCYGSFIRKVELPAEVDADKVDASYKDGVLKVALKKVKEPEGKKIEIKAE